MSIQARTHRPRGGIGSGVAARSGRRGGKAGRRQLPLGLRTRCRSHTPRGEEPGGGTEARPPPAREPPCPSRARSGSPAVPPAGAASSPLGGSGSPGARSQDGASRHASPLPPPPGGAVGTFRFAAVEPVGQRREGEGATTSERKREEEEGEVSALRALPGQPPLAARAAASVFVRAALD